MKQLAVVVLVAGLLAGCGERQIPEQEVLAALSKVEALPKDFVYTEAVPDQPEIKKADGIEGRAAIAEQTVTVDGRIQDDLRYGVKLKVDGGDAFEIIVSDDALALKLENAELVPGLFIAIFTSQQQVSKNEPPDPALFQGLFEKKWVLDYAAAPPLTAQVNRSGSLTVGKNPPLDAIYVNQYVRRAISEGAAVREFNPDEIEYVPANDPFLRDFDAKQKKEPPDTDEAKEVKKGLDTAGVKRYDLAPAALPKRSARGTSAALPSLPSFRKMAFYVKDGNLISVREEISIDKQVDFRRLIGPQKRGSKFLKRQYEGVKQGRTREPVRERTMIYQLREIGEKQEVVLPVDNVVTTTLGPILSFGSPDLPGLSEKFDPARFGGGAGAGVPAPGTGGGGGTGGDGASPPPGAPGAGPGVPGQPFPADVPRGS
ncbi:MAG TPA: hypothetical protein VNE62_09645 [Actinomycetota bacterium]|nr:hypothetical protein [Actinomycetota bacterium]